MNKKTIKIGADLDFVNLWVDGKLHSRWPINKANIKETLDKAKITAFDVAWELAELGNEITLNPYLN